MKSLLKEFVAYHLWANQQLSACILALDQSDWTKTIPSSFPSLHKTILHMLDADSIWWQRIEGMASVTVPSRNFKGDTPELVRRLLLQDEEWKTWVGQLDPVEFEKSFSYSNSRGDHFEQPLYQVILHICNHGTYHRGQLVTLLRNLEAPKIPQTDYVHWVRMSQQ
ncbi:DinB family protein [Flavihumibacter fluvii]|uniref:DinB family protein n=1 Tax=Flavihumibacter fluvii TaxID=2838157 RepID=UPI001BDF0ECF|nr:DinB family protein [Flavihumibacter fluvii]ULQ53012.1 DinB family protein [Flavihumibacter fluvii]